MTLSLVLVGLREILAMTGFEILNPNGGHKRVLLISIGFQSLNSNGGYNEP